MFESLLNIVGTGNPCISWEDWEKRNSCPKCGFSYPGTTVGWSYAKTQCGSCGYVIFEIGDPSGKCPYAGYNDFELQISPLKTNGQTVGFLCINPKAPSGDVRLFHPGWSNV